MIVKLLVIVAPTDEEAKVKEADLRKYASNEGAAVLFGGYVFLSVGVPQVSLTVVGRWLGEDLSIYADDQDLRDVENPAIRNIVKGYAAFVNFLSSSSSISSDH